MDECFVVDLNDKYPNELNGVDSTYETVGIVHLYQNEFLPNANQVITVTPGAVKTGELHPLEVEVRRSIQIKLQNQARLSSHSVIQALPNSYKINDKPDCTIFNDNGLEEPEEQLAVDQSQIPLTVQYCGQAQPDAQDDSGSEEERETLKPVYDHEPDPEPTSSPVNPTDMANTCYMCFKKFRQKKNMYAHIRKVHSSQPNIQGGIICPLCRMHFLRQEHLRKHLETLHHEQIVKEERQFTTMQEFEDWKDYIEKETFSCFISKSSTKLLASNQTKTYYKCHRSGACCSEKDVKKKAAKKQTSYKIGATCPASMEVIENMQGITVTFWATHVGHKILSKNDGSRVKGLLSSGMSWDQVLDEVQRECIDAKRQPQPSDSSDQTKYVLMDKKIVSLGRKPKPNRVMRSASQALLIQKAEHLFSVLETTEVTAAYRPIISAMIDNLTSIVKRRAVGNAVENKGKKKRKREIADESAKGKDKPLSKTRLRKPLIRND